MEFDADQERVRLARLERFDLLLTLSDRRRTVEVLVRDTHRVQFGLQDFQKVKWSFGALSGFSRFRFFIAAPLLFSTAKAPVVRSFRDDVGRDRQGSRTELRLKSGQGIYCRKRRMDGLFFLIFFGKILSVVEFLQRCRFLYASRGGGK